MKKYLFLSVICLFAVSCQKEKSYEFTLYLNFNAVSNDCKTFKILIDGQKKLSDELCFAGITPCYKEISFSIEPGVHNIKAEATGVNQIFQKSIDFSDTKPYGYLDFNQNTSEFSFALSKSGGID